MKKIDCFAYTPKAPNRCIALTEMVCEEKECKFYMTKAELEQKRLKSLKKEV